MRGARGADGRDWGSIDWSSIDLSVFGRRGRGGRPSRGRALAIALVALVVLVPLFVQPIVTFLTDLLWFRSLGLEDVYLLRFTAAFRAFVVFFLAFFVLAAPNLYFALRPQMPRVVVDAERLPRRRGALGVTVRLLPLLLVPSLLFGLAGADRWDELLRWLRAVPFGRTDPVFGRDIGFYFFTLPVLQFVRGWLLAAVVVVALGVVGIYLARGAQGIVAEPFARGDLGVGARTALALARPARAHLSVLGGLFLVLIALGYPLDQLALLFQDERVLTGAGYTSINARIPALGIMAVLAGIAAVLAFANAFARTLWLLGAAIALWLVAAIALGGVYPSLVQTLAVNPDQLNRERPYLALNIAATREAYGLDRVEESLFDVAENPRPQEVRREFADPSTVRLWDYRPLLAAFAQLQALRQYYQFNDVDVDRYVIDGTEKAVMLSAREIAVDKLPREAQTWVNRHLTFTHGFGAVLTPVGGVGSEGRPRLVVRDIPPQGEPRITEPRIYYGELTREYAVVGTSQDEFDYAQEGRDATTRFTGSGGVGIGGLWDRLLFAVRFGDGNLLFTPQLSRDSRILFHRQIAEREQLIAPFLVYDRDPYHVIADGGLYWINDAYTIGTRYPYSERFAAQGRRGAFAGDLNYVRNSVKVVTSAYDGSVTYYVVDDRDPVIRTLRAIYPSLFGKTIEDMPPAIRAHIRYPEDLFSVQAQVYATYHMTDPDNFYNRGDAWRIANEVFQQGGRPQPIEPYYVTARLPGATKPEFILFVPMTPAGGERDNMVAWIAARADPPEYGKVRVLRFSKERTIFGPLQIEARIDADATIRQQLSLLSVGGGAEVIRGNLLVLPVGNSFIYVEPLFVQAREGRIPELQRVLLATQDRVAMAESFEKAVDLLFGQAPAPSQPPPPPPPAASPTDVPALVRSASERYQRAQEALRAGDFAAYGREIKLLEEDLAKLRAATGQ